MSRPVILMRPGEANNRLASLLEDEGMSVWRWPAFSISLTKDESAVTQRLKNLDDIDMIILASPAAVAAVSHWIRVWPQHITIATVGEGTARVVRAAWGDEVNVLYPEGDATLSGSEALWALIQKTGVPARALILRGQTGREWLAEQLKMIGVDVIKLCVYIRTPFELNVTQRLELSQAMKGPSPIVYVTSTDAVDVLVHTLRPIAGALDWLAKGIAITLHPRVQMRLTEAGYQQVFLTAADDPTVKSVIEKVLTSP